jgi:hypothetical protein
LGDLATKYFHNCVIDDGATYGVQCWGYDLMGQVTGIPALVDPVATSAGSMFSCALDDTNGSGEGDSLDCWGDKSTWDVLETDLTLDKPFYIDSGYIHSCVLEKGAVQCWGDDSANQYGGQPVLSNPKQLTVGHTHNCVLQDSSGDGTSPEFVCWGESVGNYYTTIPTSPDINANTPRYISAGRWLTCALYGDTFSAMKIECWGKTAADETATCTSPIFGCVSNNSYLPTLRFTDADDDGVPNDSEITNGTDPFDAEDF